MSDDSVQQYVPLDKLKVYRNHVLVNQKLRRINFSTKFDLLENPGANSVDITLVIGPGGAGDVFINANNAFGEFDNTFRSSRLKLRNPNNTASYIFAGANITSDRNIILPLLTGNDIPVMEAFPQPLTSKTLNVDQNTIKHSTTNAAGDLLKGNGTSFQRMARGTGLQILRVNSGGTDLEFADAAAGVSVLNDLTDVVITAAATGEVIRHNGTNWVDDRVALDDLSDVVISSPVSGHHIVHNGTNWVNQSVSATTREDLCAQFGWSGRDNVTSAYQDSLWLHTTEAGSSVAGTKAITTIDFTGKTQYKIVLGLVVNGTVTPDIKIVNDALTTDVLHEFTNIAQDTHTSALTSLPGWATGVKTLRMQLGGGDSTDDLGVPHCSVYLK